MTETLRYWYDCEFIEDGVIIDLISIGIVCEDGREYYAISTEFDASKASSWVKENVLNQLPPRPETINYSDPSISPRIKHESLAWKSRKQIRDDIFLLFLGTKPELWGYYSAYDHVAFCQLFGKMIDLPTGVPMYTKDIKQWCDELGNPQLPKQAEGEHNALHDARHNRVMWEFLDQYQQSKLRC